MHACVSAGARTKHSLSAKKHGRGGAKNSCTRGCAAHLFAWEALLRRRQLHSLLEPIIEQRILALEFQILAVIAARPVSLSSRHQLKPLSPSSISSIATWGPRSALAIYASLILCDGTCSVPPLPHCKSIHSTPLPHCHPLCPYASLCHGIHSRHPICPSAILSVPMPPILLLRASSQPQPHCPTALHHSLEQHLRQVPLEGTP
mmetsp:Transcript_2294/g.5885  ORF Transcript_2294/g.5885 Transcript_2294/m.5885 type:complete len:204 (+) Transcript_2294:844-1455(+)